MSTVSYMDEPGHEMRVPVKMENTFQMTPGQRFPASKVSYGLSSMKMNNGKLITLLTENIISKS